MKSKIAMCILFAGVVAACVAAFADATDPRPASNTIACRDAQIAHIDKNPEGNIYLYGMKDLRNDGHEGYSRLDQGVSDVLRIAKELEGLCK